MRKSLGVLGPLASMILGLSVGLEPAPATTLNLAYLGNGAVPTANNSAGYGSLGGAIDGGLNQGYNQGQNTYWSNRVGAWYEVALPATAVGSELQYLRVIERDCCTSVAPMLVNVYDGGSNILTNFVQATSFQTPTGVTFNFSPGITTATRVRLEHTGATAGDMFLTELELVAFDPIVRVGGTGSLGTYALTPTSITGGSAGPVSDVRSIRLSTTGNNRLDLAEIQAFDAGAVNQALGSNGGYEFLRYRGYGLPAEVDTTPDFGPNAMTDGNTSTFEDTSTLPGALLGVSLAANMDLADLKIITRAGCCGGSNIGLQLDLFSDAARNSPVFSQNVGDFPSQGATYTIPLTVGGVATAALDPNETYRLELSATPGLNDQITVSKLQAATSQLTVDGNLEVSFLGPQPTGGGSWQVLSADTILGTFDSMSLPALTSGRAWDTSQLYLTGMLLIVPEPSVALLLALGALVVWRRQVKNGWW